MMQTRVAKIFLTFAGLACLGQGCFGGGSSTSAGPDGGIFKTADRGESWMQKRVLLQGPKAISLGNDAITVMQFDPQDHNTVYAGTSERGLIYSLNGGDSWEEASPNLKGSISALAVDYKNKCVVYAAIKNGIYKTENCSRDWERIFFDPKTDKAFTALAVDWYNPTILYAGTSEGDIFKSTDAGLSWLVTQRANGPVTSIVIDPKDSRAIYVGARGDGLWKTLDGGNTWMRIRDALQEYDNARRVTEIDIDPQDSDHVYTVSPYGILASTDAGNTWSPISLTSQPNTVDIRGFVINPRNTKELAYITKNTINLSADGGSTWTVKKLPSTRRADALMVDPENGGTLYLGMGPAPKQ